jgi:HK97 family phage portal protein
VRPLGGLLLGDQPQAKAPVDYRSRRYGIGSRAGITSAQDQTAQLGSMTSTGTLFAIVDRNASAVAATTWRLYRKAPSGLKKDRVEVHTHPALSVWRKPNPHVTQGEFIEASVQHYDLTGEYWWVLARASVLGGNGPPIELWVVRPDRMKPVPHPTEFISGYIYCGAEEVPLKLDQVITNKRPSPLDPYRGISPLASLAIDIHGERAAAAYNAAFFDNGAEPGGIIEVPDSLSDEEFDEMVARWREQHQGVHNAHRVALLERGKWVDRKYTNRDMQFIDLRKFSRDAIREAYGFPKALLGSVEDVNRANAEAAEVVFARWLVNPRNDRIRDSLNDDFLPMFGTLGQGYEFDYDTAVPESREDIRQERNSQVNAVNTMVAAGFDPAECLTVFGLPEITFVGKPGDADGDDPDPAVDPAQTPPDVAAAALMIQKIYLGVGIVLTAEEARKMVSETGFVLPGPLPEDTAPRPQTPPAPTVDPDEDEEGDDA